MSGLEGVNGVCAGLARWVGLGKYMGCGARIGRMGEILGRVRFWNHGEDSGNRRTLL